MGKKSLLRKEKPACTALNARSAGRFFISPSGNDRIIYSCEPVEYGIYRENKSITVARLEKRASITVSEHLKVNKRLSQSNRLNSRSIDKRHQMPRFKRIAWSKRFKNGPWIFLLKILSFLYREAKLAFGASFWERLSKKCSKYSKSIISLFKLIL